MSEIRVRLMRWYIRFCKNYLYSILKLAMPSFLLICLNNTEKAGQTVFGPKGLKRFPNGLQFPGAITGC